MNFGLNRLQNHHLEPRNRLDLIMMEPLSSELEDRELAAGSAAVEFDGGGGEVEREHMFDKVVTPSDVGKLNRLVIPKQHAERFFPLDSSTNDKGLLLNFEDRNGKSWRFRYSYWNSSQSYVMTKGWSRFVKEKRLDAGDIVSFQRGVGEIGRDRLYIDWRRRPELPIHHHHHLHHHSHPIGIRPSIVVPAGAAAWGSLVWRPLSATAPGYHQQQHPATAAPRDHTHLSQTNNNYNNINNNINMVYDCNRVCCPYGSGMVYNLRREVGRSRVGEDDEEELLEMNSNYQVQQEYCSGGGAGNSMVVQEAANNNNNNNNNNNYDGDYYLEKKTRTNYSDEDHHHQQQQDHEEEDIPVKKSRLRLFGVNMEMESPIIMNSCNSNSEELCDNLLLSSSSNSNPKSTTTTHQLIQLPSPSTTTTTTSP